MKRCEYVCFDVKHFYVKFVIYPNLTATIKLSSKLAKASQTSETQKNQRNVLSR